jgi:hypothetical protein
MAYPICDTFFFKVSDNGVFAARDYSKLIARQRRELMANELSRQASDDYMEDIMKHMRQMEVKRLDFPI